MMQGGGDGGRTSAGHAAHLLSITCANRHASPRVQVPLWNLKQMPPPAWFSLGSLQSLDWWPALPQFCEPCARRAQALRQTTAPIALEEA